MKIKNRAGIAAARRRRNDIILATLTVAITTGCVFLFFYKLYEVTL